VSSVGYGELESPFDDYAGPVEEMRSWWGGERESGSEAETPEQLAVRLMITTGTRDESSLTNSIFFARHPERNGRPIEPGEQRFGVLRDEWLEIRETIVRPMLARIPAGAAPAGPRLATGVWVPGAERVANARSRGLPYVAGPWRFVFHTIEGEPSARNFRRAAGRHPNPPHLWAMPSADLLLQTVPLDRASWALARPSGTVHTNRMHAIQVELWGRARDMSSAPETVIDWLARRLLAPVADLVPINLRNVRGTSGSECYGRRSPCRMTVEEWRTFDGVCGHQHVPNNSHWDPGLLDLHAIASRARALLAARTSPEAELEEETGDDHAEFVPDGDAEAEQPLWESEDVDHGSDLESEEYDDHDRHECGEHEAFDREEPIEGDREALESPFDDAPDESSERADMEGEAELDEAHGFDAVQSESAVACTFPSGARLAVVTGATAQGEEHWDPNDSGEPLYDTGPGVRSTKLAHNFSVGELASSGGRASDRARISCELVACLQRLRDRMGRPVVVTSGYRSYQRNVEIYRARGKKPTASQHSSGRAADIRISGMSGLEIAKLAMELCGTSIGVGVGRSFAHVDVRGRWARWTYFTDRDESSRAIAELDEHRQRLQQGGVLSAPSGRAAPPRPAPASDLPYRVVAGERYGRRWKDRRPPGLPEWVRPASGRGEALPAVQRVATAHGLGGAFVSTCESMAVVESGGTYALPANTFNADPPERRPPGVRLITAWGVFQYNRDAWTARIPADERSRRRSWVADGVGGCRASAGCVFPWDCEPDEEIEAPVAHFAQSFQAVLEAGGSNRDAAAAVRIRHKSPSVAYPAFLERGRLGGFASAWDGLPSSLRASIDRFLGSIEAVADAQ
jgi:hypothetical protein